MPDDVPVFLFPRDHFPITLEAMKPDGERVWFRVLEAPVDLAVLEVPPLSTMHGSKIRIRVTYGNGEVEEREA